MIYAHYARDAFCADAMADAWEDTMQAICLHDKLFVGMRIFYSASIS